PNGSTTQACTTACGDGNKDPGENCDDGNGVSGDGCSDKCEPEGGFTCKDTEVPDTTDCTQSSGKCLILPVVYRDFEGQQVSGGHPDFFYYGASATGGRTTGVATGASKTTCVPNAGGTKAPFITTGTGANQCPSTDETGPCLGLVKDTLGPDGKPQYNKNTCPCVFTDWDETGVLGTCPTGDSTAVCTPTTGISGIVDCWVEGPGTHRLRIDTNVAVIQSADSFKQWYNDSSASITVKRTLELALLSGNQYQFSSSGGRTITDDIHDIFMKTGAVTTLQSGFFPLEDQSRTKICNLWPYWASGLTSDATCVANDGNSVGSQWDPKGSGTPGTAGTGGAVKPVSGKMRNFYFTSEVRYLFRYTGAGTLAFYGDDDVWVFINGKLALDLGAPHMRLQGSVNIDATKFDLEKDKIYEIAVFHADRHPRDSNYQLTLSGFSTNRSVCQPTCGDSKVTSGEECDEGDKNQDGLYNGCTKSCKFGPFCGDGDVNGSEECDDGQNTTVT
ncbi:MAG TPA: fibro-slime domain-containing protein, partial [Polyangiaceae bacterium]